MSRLEEIHENITSKMNELKALRQEANNIQGKCNTILDEIDELFKEGKPLEDENQTVMEAAIFAKALKDFEGVDPRPSDEEIKEMITNVMVHEEVFLEEGLEIDWADKHIWYTDKMPDTPNRPEPRQGGIN